MKWSTRVGAISGIDVYIHGTFWILIGWVALSHWQQTQNLAAALQGVLFILLLFGCVVLHELGHAMAARSYGIQTRDITLLPIGGVARLERMPDDPRQELWVALAGPAVNLVIAALLYAWLVITGSLHPIQELTVAEGPLASRLLVVNVVLFLFNLLPAFPMDGGRVVRSLLALYMGRNKATQIAAGLGQAMAYLFGFLGLFTNPFLVFIALFVWIGATQEASLTQIRSALGGIGLDQAMVTNFRTLSPDQTLQDAVGLILSGSQQDFPVTQEGQVVGILTRSGLLSALAEKRRNVRVEEVMERDFQVVDGLEMLETVFAQLQSCSCHTLPVVRQGKLVGLVTMDNLGEFLMIQSALSKGGGRLKS